MGTSMRGRGKAEKVLENLVTRGEKRGGKKRGTLHMKRTTCFSVKPDALKKAEGAKKKQDT